jgi:hypothetical protein
VLCCAALRALCGSQPATTKKPTMPTVDKPTTKGDSWWIYQTFAPVVTLFASGMNENFDIEAEAVRTGQEELE